MNDPEGKPRAEYRFGNVDLAPGYLPRHVLTYLYAAFITVGLLAFVSFMQAWLMNVNLALPAHLQGRTIAGLNFVNEIVALCLVAPFGALADKIGRRPVYVFRSLWLGVGFLLYPMARSLPQLTTCALFFSVGVAAVGTMLGTVLADTPAEHSRGRLVGIAGFFQGLGAAALVLILGKTQSAAVVCLPAAVRFFRRSGGTWHLNLTLRLQQAWLERDLSMADAADRTRLPFVAAMIAGLLTALLVGLLLDRFDRLRVGVAAMALAAPAYLLCGFIDDPTQEVLLIVVAAMLGMGQIAAIIAGQTLLGQEAPREVRGAVFGLAAIFASAGILFTNGVGGWLYDSISKGGPFFLLAAVNFAIFLFGLRLASRSR